MKSAILISLMFISIIASARFKEKKSHCYKIAAAKILSLAQEAYANHELSDSDMHWLTEPVMSFDTKLDYLADKADQNAYACSNFIDGEERQIIATLLLKMKGIPKSVSHLLIQNDNLLLDLAGSPF